jgi:hypothetical protein
MHKSSNYDGAVEDVRRMEMETDALRCVAHDSRDPLPDGDTHTRAPKIEQIRAWLPYASSSIDILAWQAFEKQFRQYRDNQCVLILVPVVRRLMFFPAQPHSSVNDTSLYKHTDSELSEPDHARQLIFPCATRTPLPAPREGKDPPSKQQSGKGAKLF